MTSNEIAYLSQTVFLFYKLGDINEELQQFSVLSKKKERSIATYIMSFIVPSIFKQNFTIAYFLSNGFDSYQLHLCVWEGIRVLESVGFKVRLVIDGATPYQKFYRMHLHFDKNAFEFATRKSVLHIGLEIDMPRIENYTFLLTRRMHLGKTLRKIWENSHGHLNTKNLVVSNEIVMSSSNKFILYRTL